MSEPRTTEMKVDLQRTDGDWHVVLEHDRMPGHEPTVLAHGRAIADLDHRVAVGRVHLGGHAHGQRRPGTDEAPAPDVDGVGVGAVAPREGDVRAVTERAVPTGRRRRGIDGPESSHRLPHPIDHHMGQSPSSSPHTSGHGRRG